MSFQHSFDFDWPLMGWICLHLAIAYLLALPIAWDRERSTRSAGLRTFPLIALAACGFILVGRSIITDSVAEARLITGLMTGLGFLGGGAILKQDHAVIGMATAASIWTTGAIGLAVSFSRYEVALLLSFLTFLTLKIGNEVKDSVKANESGEPAGGGDRDR